MISRAITFLIIFGTLQFGWQLLQGSALEHGIIDAGIVEPASWLARLITPALDVRANGNQLRDAAGGLNIVNGCDGMETLFILVAGLIVAPLPARGRLGGILAGIPVVYLLNQARILTLFYAHRRDARLFDLLHGIVTPLLMVIGVIAFFHLWLVTQAARAHRSG